MRPKPSRHRHRAAHLTEGALHLLHGFALILTGQKAMLWRKRESVKGTGSPGDTLVARGRDQTCPQRLYLPPSPPSHPSPAEEKRHSPGEEPCGLPVRPACHPGCCPDAEPAIPPFPAPPAQSQTRRGIVSKSPRNRDTASALQTDLGLVPPSTQRPKSADFASSAR